MAAYAEFGSLREYIDHRCARERMTRSALADALGWPRNYIYGIYYGTFRPSRPRADAIARHFGDDAHMVRILSDLESPPPNLEDRHLREIYDLAASLGAQGRREAISYLRYLLDRQNKR